MIKAVYETVYQCYGVLQALHMKLCSRSWVQRDPWNHDSQKVWKPLFLEFSSSFGDPSKSWTPKKCREGALTSWQGRSWARGVCLARFSGHRPSPDLLTFSVFCPLWSPCRPHYHPSLIPSALRALPLIDHPQTVTKSILPCTPTWVGPHPSNPKVAIPTPVACPL